VKVIVFVHATKESEAGAMPDEKVIADMGKFKEELVKAGVMLGGEGLHPSSRGKRLHISGTERRVIDGPFVETKELVGGYWLWQVESMDDAVAWAQRCADYMPSGEWVLEIRPIFEADDFGDAFTPELRAQEERLRGDIGRRRK
jgi:hypothetical protein